jgi:succinate dehydrogenase/fumarate reductase flavoprotein subunit
MDHLSCDVLVLGSGAAGLRAAIGELIWGYDCEELQAPLD